MNTKPQNLFALRRVRVPGERPNEAPGSQVPFEHGRAGLYGSSGLRESELDGSEFSELTSDLMGLDDTVRASHQRARKDRQAIERKPEVVIITADKQRYLSESFSRLPVKWVLFEIPAEAVAYVTETSIYPALVLTEIIMAVGGENGFHLAALLRSLGYVGALCMVMLETEPMHKDKQNASAVQANDIVRFGSSRMLQILEEVAFPSGAAVARTPAMGHQRAARLSPPPIPSSAPILARQQASTLASHRAAWLPKVAKLLTNFLGPVAGDQVIAYYDAYIQRYRRHPSIRELGEELAELLENWPKDRERFVTQCRELNIAQGGR